MQDVTALAQEVAQLVTHRPSWLELLIKRYNWVRMMKRKIEMSALSDICIFPFKSSSLRHRHLIQAPQFLRNAVHFKSDVWLALPATILIEILFFFFFCYAGGGIVLGGCTAVPVSIGRNQLFVPIPVCRLMVFLQCSELLIMPCEGKFWQRACCIFHAKGAVVCF